MSNDLITKITPLQKEKWQGYPLQFHYISRSYYDVQVDRAGGNFNVSFVKKPFDKPYERIPNTVDKLFPHWRHDVKVWGIADGDHLIAAIETAAEPWNNRLRVVQLCIDDNYRRRGLGTALMNIAVQRAKDENRRVVVLETHSNNEAGIAFYLSYGFTLIGFDSCDYHNDDLNRKEVHLEMGLLL